MFAHAVIQKVADAEGYIVQQFKQDVLWLGHHRIVMRSNSEPALHTHIFPRYMSEDDKIRPYPAWFYDWENAPKFERVEMSEFSEKLEQYLFDAGVALR